MKEIKGNIWDTDLDVICITTNGDFNTRNELTMGKGIALQAKLRFPELPGLLGEYVSIFGNTPEYIITRKKYNLCSFPTKRHWWEPSDIKLIERSATLIERKIPSGSTVALPRPGCSNGGLNWKDVKIAIEPLLDNNYTIYSL